MQSVLRLTFAVVLVMSGISGAQAQAVTDRVEFQHQAEAARKLIEKERRIVFAAEMNLGEPQREAFWKVYNEYAAELKVVDEARIKLLGDYARNFDNMSDEFAGEMLKNYFDQEKTRLKIRDKYRRRFQKVLTLTQVARFYQVENKLDAIYEFQLSSQIPLIEESGAGN